LGLIFGINGRCGINGINGNFTYYNSQTLPLIPLIPRKAGVFLVYKNTEAEVCGGVPKKCEAGRKEEGIFWGRGGILRRLECFLGLQKHGG
jgi:hypothetical protein